MTCGWIGVENDYPISVKEAINITAETGALETQTRIKTLKPYGSEEECYVLKLTKEQLEMIEKSIISYLSTISSVISYEEEMYYGKLEKAIFSQLPEDWNDD